MLPDRSQLDCIIITLLGIAYYGCCETQYVSSNNRGAAVKAGAILDSQPLQLKAKVFGYSRGPRPSVG